MSLIAIRVCSLASGTSKANWHHSSFVKGAGPKPRCCMKSSRAFGVIIGVTSEPDKSHGAESAAARIIRQPMQRIFQTQKAMHLISPQDILYPTQPLELRQGARVICKSKE